MLSHNQILICLADHNEPLSLSELHECIFNNNDGTIGGQVVNDEETIIVLSSALEEMRENKGLKKVYVAGKGDFWGLPKWFDREVLKQKYQYGLDAKTISVNIALVDDQVLFRTGLKGILSSFTGVHVQADVNDCDTLLDKLSKMATIPDMCIISSAAFMPDNNRLVQQLKKNFGKMKILILTAYYHEFTIIKMIKDGAHGCLLKDCQPDELIQAIYTLYRHKHLWKEDDIEYAQAVIESRAPNYTKISRQQQRFLSLCPTGLKYEEFVPGMKLHSTKSVEGYRDALFKKFNVKNRTELTIFAIKNGIIKLNE